jgi:tetratricopeptide (TPR) repeat protein
MKQLLTILLLSVFSLTCFADEQVVSTRKERNLIRKGNELYDKKEYKNAEEVYNQALKENPMSYRALYNKALTQIRIGEDEDLKDQEQKKQYLQSGIQAMESVASINGVDPEVSSMAHYNLGNIAFKSGDYASAVQSYKQSLRLDPTSDKARKNLRIAQKKLQQQNNQNQDQQDQQQKQDNKDQQQQQTNMSQENAQQILNALQQDERNTQEKVRKALMEQQKRRRTDKEW